MVGWIPEQRLVASVCLLVAGHSRWHEVAAMPAERIDAERITSKKVFRVAIPSRVVALIACARASWTMRVAVAADADECATARSRAWMRRLEWHVCSLVVVGISW